MRKSRLTAAQPAEAQERAHAQETEKHRGRFGDNREAHVIIIGPDAAAQCAADVEPVVSDVAPE